MSVLFFVTGHSLLHSPMVVEKLGSRENPGSHDGSRPRHHIRGRETLQKEVVIGLPLRKPKKSQLLGLQILFLWITVIGQCHWWVHLLFNKSRPSGVIPAFWHTVVWLYDGKNVGLQEKGISIAHFYNSALESWEKPNGLGFTFLYFYHFLNFCIIQLCILLLT